jgi:oligopeptide/dipeptide ABC transporter ATP-binding protein
MLEINDLEVVFPQKHKKLVRAVKGLSLNIRESEVVALVGESGCGKSMTALSLLRLIDRPGKIVNGSIIYKNQDLLKLDMGKLRKIRGKEIAMVFQEPMTALNPSLSIGFQISEALKLHKKLKGKELKDTVLSLLDSVKVPNSKNMLKSFSYKLSGGLRQRVMIAMALACEPSLLIADEPTTALDVTIQAQILALLMEKKKENNLSMLFISHDLGVISQIADRVYVMYAGKIMESASNKVLFENPSHPYTQALIKSYPKKINKRAGVELYSLKGSVSNDRDNIKGCIFQDRCEYKKALCVSDEPELYRLGEDHYSACFKSAGLF